MRRLVLVLNLLVGSSLLTQSADIMAASSGTKKNNHQTRHEPRLRAKIKNARLLSAKQNKLKNPGDVWERIRSGMKIPRPSPLATLPDQALENGKRESEPTIIQKRIDPPLNPANSSDTGISAMPLLSAKAQSERMLALQKLRQPTTTTTAQYKYTPYGRLKLNAALSSRTGNKIALPSQALASKTPTLNENSDAQTRLRSRIDLNPRLHRLDLRTPSELLENTASGPEKPFKSKYFDNAENQENTSQQPVEQRLTKLIPHEENTSQQPVEQRLTKLIPHEENTSQQPVEQHLTKLIPHDNKEAIKYERVNKHVVWYAQHSSYLYQVTDRARPYLYHIVESLSQHKLPYELALLPIVESAYQPTAQSPKSAAGLWQFIPSTGLDFDLHQNGQYDDRLDITASTQAAMRYMSFLNQHFNGDWLLALAAYNCGLGTVDNAISRNVAEGFDTDYWSLRLPEETQEYVPRFLALSSIFANPDAHGLKFAPVRNEPYFVKVKIDRKHDIDYLAEKEFKEVAEMANLGYEQFSRLNPGYLDPKLANDGPYTFLMPAANAEQLHQRLDSIAQFVNQSASLTTSHSPLKRRTLFMLDEQKTALSLLTDITLPTGTDLIKVTDPFLSLTLNTNQTTPRIANQSAISPIELNPDSKRLKKNI